MVNCELDYCLTCVPDVLDILDKRCSGRQTCIVVAVVDPDIQLTNACDQDLARYLEASYTCVKGMSFCI